MSSARTVTRTRSPRAPSRTHAGSVAAALAEIDRLEAELISRPGQKRSAEKLERLLETGERMLAEHGFDRLNIDELCHAVDSPKMSFYNRFGTKERFFAAVQIRFVRRTLNEFESIRAAVRREETGLKQLIGVFVRGFFSKQRKDRGLFNAFFRHMGRDPAILRVMEILNHAGKDYLLWLLEGRLDEIPHADPEFAIRFAADIPMNAALQFALHNSGPLTLDDPRLEPTITEAMLAYLTGARPNPDAAGRVRKAK